MGTATPDGYSGWLLRMSTPDSGWILRMATTDYSGLLRTPDGYSGLLRTTPDHSGWLRRPQGFSVPSPRASLALGKPPTRLPVSPVPVLSTSTIAGLGAEGAPPYAGLWPALSGHTTLTSSHL